MSDCERCKKQGPTKLKSVPPIECFQCKKTVTQILDLHHTSAPLCSFECERAFWMDIAF